MSESQKLLHRNQDDSDSDHDHHLDFEPKPGSTRRLSPSPSSSSSRPTSTSPAPPHSRSNGFPKPQRQSSFAQPRVDGTPRTPNRVRFDDDPIQPSGNRGDRGGEWLELEDEDYMDEGGPGRERVQRLPLLTGIEAPSVTVAEEAFDPEDHLESARPRSNMRSAFMNMANSIM